MCFAGREVIDGRRVSLFMVTSGPAHWEPDEWSQPTPTLFESMARYRYAIGVAVVAAVIVGYLISSWLPQTWQATSTLFLSDSGLLGGDNVDITLRVQQEASKLESRSVYDRAAELLGGGITREDLLKQVEVIPDDAVGSIEVMATARDAEGAAQIANTVTQAYQELTQAALDEQVTSAGAVLEDQADELSDQIAELERQLERDRNNAALERRLESAQAQLLALETRISETTADAALFGAGISDVEPAVAPTEPAGPNPVRNAALAGVLALVVASAVAWWRAGSIARARLDPSAVLGAPLVAQIPDLGQSGGGYAGDPLVDAKVAEAYQFLLTSIEYMVAQSGATSILVTSALPGEGKSLTALHLARGLAIQGREVTLVDADIRTRGLTTLLRAENQGGLVALAEGEADLEDVIRRYRISETVRLPVVPAGWTRSQPIGLLSTPRYRSAIEQIIAKHDLTIIDGGSLLTTADASAVATQVSAVLLVLDAKTSEENLLKVQERLRLLPTPLIGYLVNRVPEGGAADPYTGGAEPGGFFRRLFGRGGSSAPDEPEFGLPPHARNGHAGGNRRAGRRGASKETSARAGRTAADDT